MNESVADRQFAIDVAMDQNGDFVAVYDQLQIVGGRLGPGDLYARLYDRHGRPLTKPIQVNDKTRGNPPQPAVAVDHQGAFVVAWNGSTQGGFGPSEVYARRFDRKGNPISDEFQVNTFVPGGHGPQDIAMDERGNFIITWTQFPRRGQQVSQDGSGSGIFAQRFDAQGQPLGNEFQVNSIALGGQFRSSVALDRTANFVIAWSSPDGINPNGRQSFGVYARHFDVDGVPQGPEFLVNEHTSGEQFAAGVAMNHAGQFAVLWRGSGPEPDGGGVYLRLFAPNALGHTPTLRINPIGTAPAVASIAMERRGNFLITWDDAAGQFRRIYGQLFDITGAAASDIFQANTAEDFLLLNGAVGLSKKGNLVACWASFGQDAPESWGVFGQLFKVDLPQDDEENEEQAEDDPAHPGRAQGKPSH